MKFKLPPGTTLHTFFGDLTKEQERYLTQDNTVLAPTQDNSVALSTWLDVAEHDTARKNACNCGALPSTEEHLIWCALRDDTKVEYRNGKWLVGSTQLAQQ